jgi:hypothetical protein
MSLSNVIDLPQITVSFSENPREYKRQYNRRYFAEHKEHKRQWDRQYRQKHAEELRLKKRNYYQKRIDHFKLKRKEWRKNHPGYRRRRYHRERDIILAKLGGKCQKCGCMDKRVLQVDHVNNDGKKERKELGSSGIVVRLLNLDEKTLHANYQILCLNCNWIKRYEANELTEG